MARQTFGTPQLNLPQPRQRTPEEAFASLEALRRQAEFWLLRTMEHIDQLRGNRGTPDVLADVDFKGNRPRNLGLPLTGADALRADLALRSDRPGMDFDAGGRAIRGASAGRGDQADVIVRRELDQEMRRQGQSVSGLAGRIAALEAFVDAASTPVTFTMTGTGFTMNPTGTAAYILAGAGVIIFIPNLSGTSNATTFTLTGIPAAIQPATLTTAFGGIGITDNAVNVNVGYIRVNAASGTWDVFRNTNFAANWTAAGTKAIISHPSLAYVLL